MPKVWGKKKPSSQKESLKKKKQLKGLSGSFLPSLAGPKRLRKKKTPSACLKGWKGEQEVIPV